ENVRFLIFSADGLVRIRAADRDRTDPGGDPGAVSQAAHVSRHYLRRRPNSKAGSRSLYYGISPRQPPVERVGGRRNGDDRDFPLRPGEKGADSRRVAPAYRKDRRSITLERE